MFGSNARGYVFGQHLICDAARIQQTLRRNSAMPVNDLQTHQSAPKAAKPYKGLAMEGLIASWYTKIREQEQERPIDVRKVSELLPASSRVLEVAPGPGYLA